MNHKLAMNTTVCSMSMIDRTVVRLSNVTCELLNMPPDSTIVMVDFKLKSYVCFIASTIHDKLLDEWGGEWLRYSFEQVHHRACFKERKIEESRYVLLW